MAILVILGLIVLWGVVLLPPILRSRNASGFGGVSTFMDSLRSLGHRSGGVGPGAPLHGPVLHGPVGGVPLGPTTRPVPGTRLPIGGPRPGPGGMTPMQRRRRNVLFGLGGATSLFLLVGLVAGSALVWFLFLLSAAALGGYVYLLLQFKKQTAYAAAPARRVRTAPVPTATDDSRVGDNVVVLRRHAG